MPVSTSAEEGAQGRRQGLRAGSRQRDMFAEGGEAGSKGLRPMPKFGGEPGVTLDRKTPRPEASVSGASCLRTSTDFFSEARATNPDKTSQDGIESPEIRRLRSGVMPALRTDVGDGWGGPV
jgi:hypothetical protein